MPKKIINVKVITNSKEFKIMGFDPQLKTLKVRVKSKPLKGLANKELEKNLSKFFSSPIKIVFGKKSNTKKIFVQGTSVVLEKLKKNLLKSKKA